MMRLPVLAADDPTSIDKEQVRKMVDVFLAKGFTYFDTAWMYHKFESERAVKEVLVDRYPRDSFTLATKLHCGYFNTTEERDRVFETQLEKTGAGYFDYYLLHGVQREQTSSYGKYTRLGCFEFAAEKKAQGLIKKLGFSFHDKADLLDQILTEHPEVDFVQMQINYMDWEDEWTQSRLNYEVAVKHGKPVTVMEPVKGGLLASLSERASAPLRALHPDWSPASWAIRFAASLPNVKFVLSGMSSLAQMEDNTDTMLGMEPLGEAELAALNETVAVLKEEVTIPCTGCAYCAPGCPMNIPIPRYFKLYNDECREDPERVRGWDRQKGYYGELIREFGKASDCIACGQCEGICPQHLPIITHLQTVAAEFES